MTRFLKSVFVLLLISCSSKTVVNDHGLTLMSEDAYHSTIDQWTDVIESYSGINNTVTVQGTLINTEVATAQLDQTARLYQWDQTKYAAEKSTAMTKLGNQTDVFVSFYSPERKWDDLAKSKTLWSIYLDANGQRYEGKATKVKLLPRELQSLYPYHTSFATPYIVTFPVSTRVLDGKPAQVTFTGSVDAVTLRFPPK